MVKIAISKSSRDALVGHGANPALSTLRLDGLYVISIDEEVAARLDAVHPDPDQAIRILCSTGVGHA